MHDCIAEARPIDQMQLKHGFSLMSAPFSCGLFGAKRESTCLLCPSLPARWMNVSSKKKLKLHLIQSLDYFQNGRLTRQRPGRWEKIILWKIHWNLEMHFGAFLEQSFKLDLRSLRDLSFFLLQKNPSGVRGNYWSLIASVLLRSMDFGWSGF